MRKIIFLFITVLILVSCKSQDEFQYQKIQGFVHGTIYQISFNGPVKRNWQNKIEDVMKIFDQSLSNYNSESIISKVNRNEMSEVDDEYFITCFNKAMEISKITGGAFDMTVAPLVNAYGFGFTEKENLDTAKIDSILQFVGYEKISLKGNQITKSDERVMMDASAIAKGYSVDIVSGFLEEEGIHDYLVDIGGEVRLSGKNPDGVEWLIGVDKPLENPKQRELQDILQLTDIAIATSGNYRQFYVENGVKYSHTIDPKSGYPARKSILSATVFAEDCMTADAFATACMVIDVENAIKLINEQDGLEAYFIYSGEQGEFLTKYTRGAKKYIREKNQD